MSTSPFQLLNFENCNLSLGKSKIIADDKTYDINWILKDDNNFYSENELGKWQLSIKNVGNKTIVSTRAQLFTQVKHLHYSIIE